MRRNRIVKPFLGGKDCVTNYSCERELASALEATKGNLGTDFLTTSGTLLSFFSTFFPPFLFSLLFFL